MAAINHSRKSWANGTAPPMNGTNMLLIDTDLEEACDRIDELGLDSTVDAKTTAVGADELLIRDSAAAGKVKKLTITNMLSYLGTLIAALAGKTTPVDGDSIQISDSEASPAGLSKSLTMANLWVWIKSMISGISTKTTPVDADAILITDSEDATAPKRMTWANIKAGIWSAWGALINGGTDKATPADADTVALSDSAASGATKKLTWANIKATLKNYFDTLYAALAHASRHQHGGADEIATATPAANAIPKTGATDKLDAWVSDASTTTKGKVQRASTGVEDAAKFPGATGAELAALLTAGGYTLTAPSGANSLDGIADTATWKKIAAAVATALNADTYTANDADKVTACGVGVSDMQSRTIADSLNDKYTGGMFFYDGGVTGNPAGGTYGGCIIVASISASSCFQIALSYTTVQKAWVRYLSSGSGTWSELWNASSDGNGGQPPVGKGLATFTSSLAQNEYFAITLATGGVYLINVQNPTAGGSAAALVFSYAGVAVVSSIATHTNVSIVANGADIRLTNLHSTATVLKYTICQIGN